MLRRNPTRIELKMDDILEFHKQQLENAEEKKDSKKMLESADKLSKFVAKNKESLKSTIDALHHENLSTSSSDFGGSSLVASGSASSSASFINTSISAPESDSSSASSGDTAASAPENDSSSASSNSSFYGF